jgi:arginyl-tRNA synthetase
LDYPGEYLLKIAKEIRSQGLPESEQLTYLLDRIVAGQRQGLSRFGIEFDRWVKESAIRSYIPQVLKTLKENGYIYERDGAVWFRALDFGDTEDRVLKRKTLEPTYFLSDLAYHLDKLQRGFELLIDLLGPDHHGDIPRLKGGLEALGFGPNCLEILIVQQTALIQGKYRRSMSKRAGEYVTLDDLLDEIGADALKFFLLMRKPSQHLEFDPELAKRAERANPVYYVQYAHARICQILGFARDRGLAPDPEGLELLRSLEERELIKRILELPDVVISAALKREPHQLVYQLIELATYLHYFYERHRVVSDDPTISSARLYLVWAIRTWLKRGLDLIGVSAPERM